MKKILISIITMFMILCIPNISKAASFCYGRTMAGIYAAMRAGGEDWITMNAESYDGSRGWEVMEGMKAPGVADGYQGSVVWSTGGTCCGHENEGVRKGVRIIRIIDVDKKTTDRDLNYLAYTILYSVKNHEHTMQAGNPVDMKGKWSITNWIYNAGSRFGVTATQFNAILEFGNSGRLVINMYPYNRFDGSITIGSKTYEDATEYVDEREEGAKLKCNEEKMEEWSENGNSLQLIKKKNQDGDNVTLIGPYSLNIKRRYRRGKYGFYKSEW